MSGVFVVLVAGFLTAEGRAQEVSNSLLNEARRSVEMGLALTRLKEERRNERDILIGAKELRAAELRRLKDEISKERDSINSTEAKLAKERERNRENQTLGDELAAGLERLEANLRNQIPAMPPPLRVAVVQQLTPDPRAANRASQALRLHRLSMALRVIDRFHREQHIISETRRLDDGREIEIQVVYLGLAQAYFSDVTGNHAGTGGVRNGSWQWQTRPELGARIRQLFARYQADDSTKLTPLPLHQEAAPR